MILRLVSKLILTRPTVPTLVMSSKLCSHRSFSSGAPASSSSSSLVTTDLDSSKGIATVTMQHPPVNSLSLEMCQALSEAIQTAEQEPKIQALILTSSNPTIFSAGLDLLEMHKPDPDRLVKFWYSFQQLYLDLYGSRLACIAAMQGHAPAAGCMLALSCDYRIMAATAAETSSKITIGLNESKLGIVAPPWLGQQFIDTVGRRRAELALTLGTLYSPEEALAIELVDEVVPSNQVMEKAQEVALQFALIPAPARLASKMLLRKDRLDKLVATRQEDIDHFVGFVTNEKTQKSLSAYLEMLAKKANKN